MSFSSWWRKPPLEKKPPPEETVPKSQYDTLRRDLDTTLRGKVALIQEVSRLQEQVADLTGKYTALGFDEALVRGMAEKATRLLERVSTTHRASPNFKREIDVLVGEARSAGLIEEKGEDIHGN